MLTRTYRKIFFVLLIFILSLFVAVPRKFSVLEKDITLPGIALGIGSFTFNRDLELKLGLDLAGGSHLVFEADVSNVADEDRQSALDGTKVTIERRVNLFGVSESSVKTAKVGDSYRVIAELPGIKDTQQAIDLIGQTARLEFWELEEVEVKEKEATPSAEFVPTPLSGSHLKRSRVEFDPQTGKPVVGLEFNSEGAKEFEEITKRNVSKPLAVVIDNQIITAPTVQQEISGGNAVITGNFTLDEAKQMSVQLNSGALPLPVQLIEQRTVEASLGSVSVGKSLVAGIIGLGMVAAFMLIYYLRLGIFATFSLLFYALLTLSIYKLVPVVLTLPGIAGFILSVGMAVDTNILVFERMKEEVRRGSSYLIAMEAGFARAWTSIRDANFATLFIVFILLNPLNLQFLHTSGPVRGFAITLGIGVLLNLFTGIFITRTIMRFFAK